MKNNDKNIKTKNHRTLYLIICAVCAAFIGLISAFSCMGNKNTRMTANAAENAVTTPIKFDYRFSTFFPFVIDYNNALVCPIPCVYFYLMTDSNGLPSCYVDFDNYRISSDNVSSQRTRAFFARYGSTSGNGVIFGDGKFYVGNEIALTYSNSVYFGDYSVSALSSIMAFHYRAEYSDSVLSLVCQFLNVDYKYVCGAQFNFDYSLDYPFYMTLGVSIPSNTSQFSDPILIGSANNSDYYQSGYNDGYNKGYDTGMSNGRTAGYNDGYESGTKYGEKVGYDKGYEVGKTDGEKLGYDNGYAEGKENGIESGRYDGIQIGREEGYNVGVSVKYADISPLQQVANAVTSLMSIEVLPGIKFTYIFYLGFGVLLLGLIIKIFLGG